MPHQDIKKTGERPEAIGNKSESDTSRPSPIAPRPPSAGRRIFCELDADTFALVNWVRMKHQPADMDSWLRATLRRAALAQAQAQIAGGRPLKQGMAEVLSRVRENTSGERR